LNNIFSSEKEKMDKLVYYHGTIVWKNSDKHVSRNHDLPAQKEKSHETYNYLWIKHGRYHREKNLPSFIGYFGTKEFLPKKERQAIWNDGCRLVFR